MTHIKVKKLEWKSVVNTEDSGAALRWEANGIDRAKYVVEEWQGKWEAWYNLSPIGAFNSPGDAKDAAQKHIKQEILKWIERDN